MSPENQNNVPVNDQTLKNGTEPCLCQFADIVNILPKPIKTIKRKRWFHDRLVKPNSQESSSKQDFMGDCDSVFV